MSQDKESPREVSSPEKSEEINAESRMADSLPEEKFDKPSNLRLTEKPKLSNIHPTVTRAPPCVPSLEPTDERTPPRILVNEMKKARQRPRRILPYLPPVVQELLRWSIHPQDVWRGAASVSHLLTLPTIEEEDLPSVQMSQTLVQPRVPRVRRSLPSIPPMKNRALPSKANTRPASKPLPKSRVEFRKRMLPTLPTIKEQTSPRLRENEEARPNVQSEEKEVPPQPNKKEESRSVKTKKKTKVHKSTKENHNSLRLMEKKPLTPNTLQKVERTTPSLLSADSNALINSEKKESLELPRLRAKLARRAWTMFEPTVKERTNSRSLGIKQALPSITTEGPVTPKPPSTPKPTVTRTHSTDQPLANIQPIREAMMPKPPSTPKPNVAQTRPMIQATVDRPLPNIQPIQEAIMPKPPSTPKPRVARRRAKILAAGNRPLPSVPSTPEATIAKPPSAFKPIATRPLPKIKAKLNRSVPSTQLIEKQAPSSLRSSNLQSLVKQPLSSVQMEENYRRTAVKKNEQQ